jgi:cytochrome c oxidase subunit 2
MSLKRVLAQSAGALGATVFGVIGPALSGAAFAQDIVGEPKSGEIGFQAPATSLAVELDVLHNWILTPIIFVIAIFVMLLLLWVIYRYNDKRNPVPSKITHNTTLELVWTVLPALILFAIALPSFKLLYHMLDIPKPGLTIKAIGHQWYWSYVYPDNGDFTFDARLVTAEADVAAQKHVLRLLDTDEEVVLPTGTNIRIQITSEDVIHSWTIPSFGIKHDAVPGRINESWFNIDKPGIYYGQCSELCGMQHAYMPIKVHAVSPAEFATWVKQAQGKYDKAQQPAASIAPQPSTAPSQLAQSNPTANTQIQPAN